MKIAYPYNDNLIPTSACTAESSPARLTKIATYVEYMGNYHNNIKIGIKPYAGAFLYVQSFANIANTLYQHYDDLPSIYFDLLKQALKTISTTKPDNSTDKKDTILSKKQALLIYHLAATNENSEKYNKLASKYYAEIKKKPTIAADPKISLEHYLGILCRRLAEETRVTAIKESFTSLADTFTKEKESQQAETLIPDKQPSSPRYNLRSRRNRPQSPAYFKTPREEPETVKSNNPTSNQQTRECRIL